MSDGAWEAVAIAGLLFAAWTLLLAARESLKPHVVDLQAQARGLLLSYGSVAALILVLGLEIKPPFALIALVGGAAGGYFAAQAAGYEDNWGDVVTKGSAWYLAPVALSAAIMVYGAIDGSDTNIALGVLGGYIALGIGTGQVIFGWLASMKLDQAWDVYFDSLAGPPEEIGPSDLPAMFVQQAISVETCPNGHPITHRSRFCGECGEPAYCPNGHRPSRTGLSFCNDCGAAMRG